MQTYHTIQGMRRELLLNRREGLKIGLVATMGNLHAGHIELINLAKQTNHIVVCSIFVNELQFGLNEDWDRYPRTFSADCEKLLASGCDYLFCPDDLEMYPNGLATQSKVICPVMTNTLCGASRPGHFEGVTTVVSKLFNIIQPDESVFGLKDYQQLAVIRRMVEDLCLPVKLIAAPIYREPDGLAMSSRNVFITEQERSKVTILKSSLDAIAAEIFSGKTQYHKLEQEAIKKIETLGFRVDYIAICNSRSLEPAAEDDSELVVLGAIFTEAARIIDNVAIVREN